MTKIAVCMSGHVRSWDYCFKSVRKFIFLNNHPNFDLFFSTWSDPGDNGKIKLVGPNSPFVTPVNAQTINERYGPWLKRYYIEDPEDCCPSVNQYPAGIVRNIASMYYKIQDSWRLMEEYEKENGFQYDIVLRIRPDLRMMSFVAQHMTAPALKNIFCIPTAERYGGYNDQFYMASRPIANVVMNLYTNYRNYYEQGAPIGNWAEALLKYQLEKYKIPIHVIHPKMVDYQLYRIPTSSPTEYNLTIHDRFDNHHLCNDPFWGNLYPAKLSQRKTIPFI